MFVDRLITAIKKYDNPTVAGLDPKLDYVPAAIRDKAFRAHGEGFRGAAEAITVFNKRLIDALCDIVPAVKPQLAYYEMYGTEGIRAFEETCRYARTKGLLVIADGKRNDIGSTAQAYSTAYLGRTKIETNESPAFDADALTVNPYLGYDGIKPFIDDCVSYEKGIFVLVKTSNKSSGQLQDLVTEDGKHIYEKVAEMVDEWGSQAMGQNGYSSVGAVVGATWPDQAAVLRGIMKKAYILVPGYGAQGGTAADAVRSFNDDGLGAVINASRSIMCAWKSERWKGKYTEDSFDHAAREEAIRMRNEIRQALSERDISH
ncbi:MAG: orotidine-5'-phosphate decarboxylase [Clostridiaceae bacterium]|jgi:orotidine-5'-phosphate decarboxylase|nr:orotidine-5'-phosphate decarboxylase [Clostridiaceae bacterium]